ncbi:hypothetical protein MHYP_G00110590 [Metynnis hypsauchen]
MESASLEERMNRQEHQLEELCGMLQKLLIRSDQPHTASTPTTPSVPTEQNSSTSTTPTTRPPVSIALPERYDGSPDLFIEHHPEQFLMEIDKIHFVISLLTGKAKAWASALWTQNSNILQQIDSRDAVIRCLIHFLGESTEELIKDYQQDVSKYVIEQDIKDSMIKILVLGNAAEGAPPTDVIIVIDGTECHNAKITEIHTSTTSSTASKTDSFLMHFLKG